MQEVYYDKNFHSEAIAERDSVPVAKASYPLKLKKPMWA